MTRQWTLAESRLIAERVMEWEVFEFEGRLWLTDPNQRPAWLWDCAIPDWPNDPAAAAMALAAWLGECSQHRAVITFDMESRRFDVRLENAGDMRYPVAGDSQSWPEAVMLAVLAAVEG